MTIYSLPACTPCQNLKLFLKRKDIQFEETDITPHLQDFYNKGFRSAPVVEINGELMSGSNISRVWDELQSSPVHA